MWSLQCLLLPILLGVFFAESHAGRSFSIDYHKNEFMKDGQVFRYISGSMHYFKVPTELWRDRLQKMKFGGLNAVQTYIQWSTIERMPGVFDFSGNNNVTRFIQEAAEEGLLAIVRVGPFIDAEVDMGGLPSWLLKDYANPKLRTNDPHWLKAVDRYLNVLLPKLKPLLYHNGGPIIMVQVENEYGSYGPECSHLEYKIHMRDTFKKLLGPEAVLFTTDGNGDGYLKCGMIPEVFATSDYGAGTDVHKAIATLRRHQKNGPIVNSEYYSGWLDHWETKHSMVNSHSVSKTLDEMLTANMSVNIYMFHGGTHFGWIAGSNLGNEFQPVPTSYDYDAPISEAGDLTQKFFDIKNVIKKHFHIDETHKTFVNVADKMVLPPVKMEQKAAIFDLLPEPIVAKDPKSFEELDHSDGFLLYSHKLAFRPTDPAILSIEHAGLHDRAQVFVDKEYVGTMSSTHKVYSTSFSTHSNTSTIDIFVENQGRICYGHEINQRKGITHNVIVDKQHLFGHWSHYKLFDNWDTALAKLHTTQKSAHYNSPRIPSFYSGKFVLPNKPHYPLDSFLEVGAWNKGVAFLNGHNLGRYWPVAGPQLTLYVPSVFFKPYPHENEIVLFELEHSPCFGDNGAKCTVHFTNKHVINGPIPQH